MRVQSLVLRGRDPSRSVPVPFPVLLAPMDGYTDRGFRDAVLDLGSAGGAATEFLRISVAPLPRKVIRRELGDPPRTDVPVAVQLMAPDPEHVPETVANACDAGARWIDLNFGCPVRRVVSKCAGSALLDFPDRLAAIVAAAVGATGAPVTAKIRAGVADDRLLDDVLDAAADAGAAAVTLHARLRVHSYGDPAHWEWIARAAARLHARTVPVPLVGNGGVATAADVPRMFAETGCDAVMIGRGALADPWIFREVRGGPPATRAEVLAFARSYLDLVCPPGGPRGPLARYKAFLSTIRAGGLFEGRDPLRRELLSEHDPERVRARLAADAAGQNA